MTYPYAGSSGHSGTDTSAARAEHLDASGATARLQSAIGTLLEDAGAEGLTVAEIKKMPGYEHHGTTSGALSVLHKNEQISRLLDKRGGCRIYTANRHVNGRATDSQGRSQPVDPLRGLITKWITRNPDTGISEAGRLPQHFILALRQLMDIP